MAGSSSATVRGASVAKIRVPPLALEMTCIQKQVKMTPRMRILSKIAKLHKIMNNTPRLQERIEILEDISVLRDILMDVSDFENQLIAELDVD
jgi:hypothetical protein